jgi:hypothetical protein
VNSGAFGVRGKSTKGSRASLLMDKMEVRYFSSSWNTPILVQSECHFFDLVRSCLSEEVCDRSCNGFLFVTARPTRGVIFLPSLSEIDAPEDSLSEVGVISGYSACLPCATRPFVSSSSVRECCPVIRVALLRSGPRIVLGGSGLLGIF